MSPIPAIRLERPIHLARRPAAFDRSANVAVDQRSMSLHISKLRGISMITRRKLKRQGITYTHQLLMAAGASGSRRRLSRDADIDEETLTRLVERADLARINGIGAIFADMLNRLGVNRVSELARQDPTDFHRTLQTLNAAERFARRAPTPEEVRDWISQARALPPAVDG